MYKWKFLPHGSARGIWKLLLFSLDVDHRCRRPDELTVQNVHVQLQDHNQQFTFQHLKVTTTWVSHMPIQQRLIREVLDNYSNDHTGGKIQQDSAVRAFSNLILWEQLPNVASAVYVLIWPKAVFVLMYCCCWVNIRCFGLAGKGSLFRQLWEISVPALPRKFSLIHPSLCCVSSPPLHSQMHHTFSSTLHHPLFSLSFSTSFAFFSFCHHFKPFFFATTPSSLSLIKLAGALIKCSSPSRPPPVGLGRALIPSPVRASLKSTARETAGFFNFPFA